MDSVLDLSEALMDSKKYMHDYDSTATAGLLEAHSQERALE